MAFDKTIHAIDLNDPMLVRVEALLHTAVKDHWRRKDDPFLTGSYVYNECPRSWEKDHDIDVVFRDDLLPGDLREHLYQKYGSTTNKEYEDLSLYFRTTDGQVFNFITLKEDKHRIWQAATALVTDLCRRDAPTSEAVRSSREMRVQIFIACERLRISKEDAGF